MKTKKFLKLIILTTIILLMTLLLTGGTAKATLQSNSSTKQGISSSKYDILTVWVAEIRKMEAAGGAMGLSETFDTGYIPTTSNGIDVHCIKSTEYGAMAILSASGYGNPNQIAPSGGEGSTTGNDTGVIIATNNYEWTTGVVNDTALGVDARYYDLYRIVDPTSAKAGDALGASTGVNYPGCWGWHITGSSSSRWISDTVYGFVRGGHNSIFEVDINNVSSGSYGARGVAVCGEGL